MELLLRLIMPQIFDVHAPGMYTADPEVGYVLTPGFSGYVKRSEFETPFQIGLLGLRGKDPGPLTPITFRILILGDSQAFGFGVTDDETFACHLETKLAQKYPDIDVQVLNAGVPGYGTADQFAFLKSKGKLFQPDLVIVQFLSVNDIEESRSPAKDWAIIQDRMLTSKSSGNNPSQSPPNWRRVQNWMKTHIHLARLISDRLGYLAMKWGILGNMEGFWGEDFASADAVSAAKYLAAIAKESRQLKAECLFLYTTGQVHVFSDTAPSLPSAGFMEAAAKKANVEWINSVDSLRRRSDKFDLYYPKDGHWTPAGHKAIAEILYEFIVKQDLINKKSVPD